MGMLSYKQYKLLNENLDSVIGISMPTNVGLQSEAPQLMMRKMMNGDVPPGLGKKKPPMGGDMGGDMGMGLGGPDDADMGDEDMEDMGDEDMGDEGDEDMDDDDEDADADDMGDEGDEDMDDDEDADDMGDEDMGDMGGDMGPMGAGSPPPGMGGLMGGPDMAGGLGGPPMGKKKKPMPPQMMSKMGGSMYMKKEAAVDPQDAKMKAQNRKNKANDQNDCGPGPASKKTTTVREDASCCEKCGKMMKKKCNKMTKEQREFNDSLMRQAGSLKFAKDELGFWVPVKEDVLIQPQQNQATESEPQAGEVGFAPQQKVGIVGSNFQEWANRHTAAIKKNKKK